MIYSSSHTGKQQPAQTAESDAITIDILSLFALLWRRKFLILFFGLAGFLLSSLVSQYMSPRYTARSLLLLASPKSSASAALSGIMGSHRFDNSYIVGQVEIMRSRMMGRVLVERLGLYPVVGSTRQKLGLSGDESPSSSFKYLSLDGLDSDQKPGTTDPALEDAVSAFLRALSVRAVPGSSAIQVEFVSDDPERAALVANAVVDLYIDQKLEDRFEISKRVNRWMDDRLTELQQDVVAAEQALQIFKQDNKILQGRGNLVSAESLTNLNAQLIKAQTEVQDLEIQLQQIDTLMQQTDGKRDVLHVLQSALGIQLQREEFALQRKLLDLSARYGPKHPLIIQARAELERVQRSVDEEAERAVEVVRHQLSIAKANFAALQEDFEGVSDRSLSDTTLLIRLRALEREAASAHAVYNQMLENYKRTGRERELQGPDARVISYAVPPSVPTAPNKPLIISLGTFLSLCAEVLLAIILSKLDQSVRSASQLERLLNVPCYGLVPAVPKVTGPELSKYVVKYPGSLVAEAVRTLRTVVNLRSMPEPAKVVSVTSSFSGEGKTVLSSWIARATAKAGEKVIVIDCDLRRPNIHKTLGEDNPVSIVEYLNGEAELEEIIQKDPVSGMHMIYARAVPHHALYLMGSERMRNLIEALRQIYDLVILDTPACLAVSDAQVLAMLSDVTLYGVSWGETPRDAIEYGTRQFLDIGVPLASVLMNVDVAKQVRYGYGESVYYAED